MHSIIANNSVCCLFATRMGLSVILSMLLYIPLVAQVRSVYFTPFPENSLHSSFKTFTSVINHSIGNQVCSTNSVLPIKNGYEADINNSVQSTMKICRNGDADSVCNTYLLNTGDVIILDNNVTLSRNPSQIKYDRHDNLGANKHIALSLSGTFNALRNSVLTSLL